MARGSNRSVCGFQREILLALSAIGAMYASVLLTPAAADPALEMAVKAAYLLKLPQFVDWPQSAFPSPTSPFNLCIVADRAFGDLVERTVAGEHVNERPFVVQHLDAADPKAQCQILYVDGESQSVAQSLAAIAGNPVLTVTDSQTDEAARGIVNLLTANNHVRFEIDQAAANRNHLEISSKLLSIAASVHPIEGVP